MEAILLKSIFSEEELQIINDCIDHELATREYEYLPETGPFDHSNKVVRVYEEPGRKDIELLELPPLIQNKVTKIANLHANGKHYSLAGMMYAEYSGKYGKPRLWPHYDMGDCDFMIDYQLRSNTRWDIGMHKTSYQISDNDGLIIYPVSQLHWRPDRIFADDEFVGMIFFRFYETTDAPSNPRIGNHQDYEEIMKIVFSGQE